mmetsp:Transcript_126069/g.177886  ORF Transcript_126069/g.177886 Transcript_126069/m.177886 type:complete len:213 (-) Transcript_126069:467-1105(-)
MRWTTASAKATGCDACPAKGFKSTLPLQASRTKSLILSVVSPKLGVFFNFRPVASPASTAITPGERLTSLRTSEPTSSSNLRSTPKMGRADCMRHVITTIQFASPRLYMTSGYFWLRRCGINTSISAKVYEGKQTSDGRARNETPVRGWRPMSTRASMEPRWGSVSGSFIKSSSPSLPMRWQSSSTWSSTMITFGQHKRSSVAKGTSRAACN